jgi:hypothetical protein
MGCVHTTGEITRVTQAPWSIGDVTTAAGCVFKGDGSGIAFCANPVDINFATYEMGISHFNENPHSRIAVIGLVFVALFTVLRLKGAIIMGACWPAPCLSVFLAGQGRAALAREKPSFSESALLTAPLVFAARVCRDLHGNLHRDKLLGATQGRLALGRDGRDEFGAQNLFFCAMLDDALG